ncbi:MAG: CHASE2 domain-containing protein, partial [Nitrospinales bacterium]
FIKSNENIDLSTLPFRSAYAVESNISVIAKKVRRAGYFTFDAEQDGSIRKLPLIVKYHDTESGEDYYFPPLSIRMLEKYLRGTLLFKVNEYGIEKVLLQGTETLEIPTNERGELYINYLGPSDSFPIVSATDIVNQNYENVPLGSLKDKIVILGPTATALEDIRLTPFDPVFPGVEIHATVIDNILQKNHIFQPDWVPAADSGYMLVMGILLIFIYSRIKPIYGGFIWLAIVIIQLFVNHWIFTEHKFWVSNVFPQIENFFLFISLMIHRYITEEKQKHFIQNVFGQFLSPKVVDQLIEDPSKLKLGGEQKELTAFFSDVAGFSSISENLSPTELVELLNEYLSAMSDILVDHDGTIDKYEGDAIIAFFGAPVNYPDHAKRACLVSLEMQKKLREMRQNWKSQNRPQLNVRIGLNTGLMVIGNMGSTRRMDYTMMGDSVNLASRLEGVNKQYGTFTMLSEFTYIQAKEVIEARELDMIRVVGKSEPIKIYELLGKIGELDGTTQQLVSHFNEGRENYRKRQWDTAITCFQKALAIKSDDGPSSTFMKRCTLFKQSPPPDEWDGVFAMTEK